VSRIALNRGPESKSCPNGGIDMKPSTESEIDDRVHEVKGKIKEEVGQLTINPGKDQKKIAQLQKVIEKP
jgi:uncharacterized protein YjbJ (UPF0337 family)